MLIYMITRNVIHCYEMTVCQGGKSAKKYLSKLRQSGDGSLIEKKDSRWYIACEVMTNAKESADTCGEWNLSSIRGRFSQSGDGSLIEHPLGTRAPRR